MSGAQQYRKIHQRGKLFRTNQQDALNILQNAQIASTSSLVAHQDLYAVPYPDHNHPDLRLDLDTPPTYASTVIDVLTMDPESYKLSHQRQAFMHVFEKQKNWYFNASRSPPITEKEWDIYDTRLRTLIIDHVFNSLLKRQRLDEQTKRLLKGHVSTTDSLSSTPQSRFQDTLSSMVTPHLNEYFFICEDPEIERQALENISWRQLGLATIPAEPKRNASASGEWLKYKRALQANTDAMVKLREYINHCYVWFLHTVSTKEVQDEFKQLHSEFVCAKLRENSRAKFTAQVLVNHITSHYLTDNTDQIKLLERKIEKVVRYENESLMEWLDRFQKPITKLEIAKEQTITDEAELKALWKDLFVGNISGVEHTVINRDMAALKMDPTSNFTPGDFQAVEQYRLGKFDVLAFRKMLTHIKTFPLYKPDRAVRMFNDNKWTKLDLGTPSYVKPPDGGSTTATRKRRLTEGQKPVTTYKRSVSSKRQTTARNFLTPLSDDGNETLEATALLTPQTKRNKALLSKPRLPKEQWCKHDNCIKRKTHMYHTTQTCKFPPSSATQGLKKKFIKPLNKDRRPASNLFPKTKDVGPCWNCHEMGHLQRDCPRIKKAANFLSTWEESACLLSELFTTEAEQDAAWRVLANVDKLCLQCLRSPAECQRTCQHESPSFLAAARSVKTKIGHNPELLDMFRHAYEHVDAEGTGDVGPATAHAFLTNVGGQDLAELTDGAAAEIADMESSSADVSLDTDTALNQQEPFNAETIDGESHESDMLDEQPLEFFFTRFENEHVTPCTNVGIECNSSLYHQLHQVIEDKPLWQHEATNLKSTAGNKGKIAVGVANILVPEDNGNSSWQTRKVYLDSCGSFPLVQMEELHDVKDAAEYGLPRMRFSTLESKTSWYDKVGLMRLRIQNGPVRNIRAYAYTTKSTVSHSNTGSFYLFDMSTLLDLNIDLRAHMLESRDGNCIPLRTINVRPQRWKVGGVRRDTKTGPKFSAPHNKRRAVAREAKALMTKWKAYVKEQKRHIANTAKAFRQSLTARENSPDGECNCMPRIVDSLTLEDYLHLQEDLQALTLQGTVQDALQYESESQPLLHTCCSPTPQHSGAGDEAK